ncbi:MAG: rod shape-determining protein MreD [Provencibacterium sp.]|nr:rod shape-determining protein MreD [Provencibacterium sp.]
MINNRRRVLFQKYTAYIFLFIILYVLQSTPGLFSVLGIRPVLLIPAAVTLAMYEGGFIGGLFGALAGMLCDLGAFSFYGLYSMLLLCCAAASGLLVVYLMRRTLRVAMLLTSGTAALCCLLRFYFDYGLWGYGGISGIFWEQTVPTAIYTAAAAPLFFYLFRRLNRYFSEKISA